MRPIAHIVLTICSLFIAPLPICSAEEHTSWKLLGQVKIQKNNKNLATIAFRPELSLEENNQILAVHRSKTTSWTLTLPASKLLVAGRQPNDLVDRPILIDTSNQRLQGRITAIVLSPSQQASIFAQFDHQASDTSQRTIAEETGVLSIGE